MMDAKDWRAVRIEQLEAENTSRKAELAAAQAKIDRLMLEFCPEEMTEEQTDEWARSQQPAHFPFSADRVTHHKIEIAAPKPVAWVKYGVGVSPHFVPVVNGVVTFSCSVIESLEYEPLYAAPVVQPETKAAGYWRKCHEIAEATNVALRKQIAELIASAEGKEMTRDELIELAKEAGAELYAETICVNGKDADEFVTRFANLCEQRGVEKEREECAKICEQLMTGGLQAYADAIRARKP